MCVCLTWICHLSLSLCTPIVTVSSVSEKNLDPALRKARVELRIHSLNIKDLAHRIAKIWGLENQIEV